MSEDYGIAIGEASYGDGGNNWKVAGKSVDNIYRILPPLGDLASEGKWEAGHAGHWGYENSEGRARLFKCIEVRNPETKEIIVACPECSEHIAPMQADRKRRFNQAVEHLMTKKGMSQEQAERTANEALKPFDKSIDRFNRSFRIYVNAVNEKGEIGVLNMAFRHLQLLRKEMSDLRKAGVDPLGVKQGAWFNFKYSNGQDHSVKVVMVGSALEGQRLKPGALSVEILKRLKNEACLNLADPWKAARLRELTADQIHMLVKSKGDPAVVDTLFSRGEKRKMAETTVDISTDLAGVPGFGDTPEVSAPAPAETETKTKVEAKSAPLSPPDITATEPEFESLFGGMQ